MVVRVIERRRVVRAIRPRENSDVRGQEEQQKKNDADSFRDM